jgi:phage N-6-adenine-methyltransferase
MNAGMYSSATDEWETPQAFFDEVNEEFGLDLDVCATAQNKKCRNWISRDLDGLSVQWFGNCWMNPPYGKEIGKWVKKAYEESRRGVPLVVCLLPARTDTKWFHDYILGKAEIRFIKGRLKFGGSKNSAPFPSMIAVFKGGETT